MTSQSKADLVERLRNRTFTIAPGVFEMISARIADSMGFPAIYMTGYGAVASYLGLPDAGLATFTATAGINGSRKQLTTLVVDSGRR